MDSNTLREQLAKLHAELADAQQVEPHIRELLGKVMVDISRLIEQPATAHGASTGSPRLPAGAMVADQLEGVAVRFEADHPSLAASIRRFVDLLGKVGL